MNGQQQQQSQTGGDATGQTSQQQSVTGQSQTTQTSENKDFTLEQAKEQIAKMTADFQHMLTVHNEMKTKFDKKLEAEKVAATKALEEQGKFKELYESTKGDHESLKSTVERQNTVISKLLEAEMAKVPEKFKTIIPQGDAISQLEWIAQARNAGVFEAKQQQSGDGTPPPAKGSDSGFMSIYKK
jgi:hypothetical protein